MESRKSRHFCILTGSLLLMSCGLVKLFILRVSVGRIAHQCSPLWRLREMLALFYPAPAYLFVVVSSPLLNILDRLPGKQAFWIYLCCHPLKTMVIVVCPRFYVGTGVLNSDTHCCHHNHFIHCAISLALWFYDPI